MARECRPSRAPSAGECEAARLSPTGRGRVFADASGGMTVTLEQMLEVFRNLVPPPGEERWFSYAAQMTEMERELSAFASQRDLLRLVPLEAIPERYHWLRAATDDDTYLHVCSAYGMDRMSGSKVSDVWMAMLAALRRG